MSVAIDKEPFSQSLCREILPLGQKCWEESTINKADTCAYYGERDFEIIPDVEVYQKASDENRLVLITLRDGTSLKGYVVGFLYRSWHHTRILCANVDSIYLEPDYRSYAAVVADRFEKEFQKLGAAIIGWPTHINGPMYEVLKARGYVGDDIVMEKRITPCV